VERSGRKRERQRGAVHSTVERFSHFGEAASVSSMAWSDYRPGEQPNHVLVWHHKNRKSAKIPLPLLDVDGTEPRRLDHYTFPCPVVSDSETIAPKLFEGPEQCRAGVDYAVVAPRDWSEIGSAAVAKHHRAFT
jgi:hypothetical protein